MGEGEYSVYIVVNELYLQMPLMNFQFPSLTANERGRGSGRGGVERKGNL